MNSRVNWEDAATYYFSKDGTPETSGSDFKSFSIQKYSTGTRRKWFYIKYPNDIGWTEVCAQRRFKSKKAAYNAAMIDVNGLDTE